MFPSKNLIMRTLIFILSLAICLGCQEETYIHKDLCPLCVATVKLNGEDWLCKPDLARFQIQGQDTFFTLSISEIMPTHDKFTDGLLFKNIPSKINDYKFDSTLPNHNKPIAKLFVFEPRGAETPVDYYEAIYDGQSNINVEYLNNTNDSFRVTFNLTLHPQGIPDGPIYNNTYPSLIKFSGQASGVLTYEEK